MIADDDWLNFHYAVMEIKAKLGVSIGKAQSILRQLCGSGEVRSQKQPYTTTVLDEFQGGGPPQKIEPCEWREREIDLIRTMTDVDTSLTLERATLGIGSTNRNRPSPKPRPLRNWT